MKQYIGCFFFFFLPRSRRGTVDCERTTRVRVRALRSWDTRCIVRPQSTLQRLF
jgi:hypothetical protein